MNLQSFATSAKVAMANLPSPHLHWVQSFEKLIFATYLQKANFMQICFFVLCLRTTQMLYINKHPPPPPIIARVTSLNRVDALAGVVLKIDLEKAELKSDVAMH